MLIYFCNKFTFTPEGILLKDGEILISGKEYQASLYLGATYTPNNSTTGMKVTIRYVIKKNGIDVCYSGSQTIIKCNEGCTSCNQTSYCSGCASGFGLTDYSLTKCVDVTEGHFYKDGIFYRTVIALFFEIKWLDSRGVQSVVVIVERTNVPFVVGR